MIAALYVQRGGPYWGLPGVDPWDEARDARQYAGPNPVVAHPPCSRWCRLAGLVQARWGYKKGDDDGCFAAALAAVRRWGGVLEHPAYSEAFRHFDLPAPLDHGGWQRGLCGGWSCHVEQWHYGHAAKKATWLYAFGLPALPSLRWGMTPDRVAPAYVSDGRGDAKRRKAALVSWCGNKVKYAPQDRRRLGGREASATPPIQGPPDRDGRIRKRVEFMCHRERDMTPVPFRDLLLAMAMAATRRIDQ